MKINYRKINRNKKKKKRRKNKKPHISVMTPIYYYGRHKIDKPIVNFYIEHPHLNKNSFFIELGADSGLTFSNTLALERHLGWNGICIEANPYAFSELQKNRRCHTEQSLVYSKNNKTVQFLIRSGKRMLSGIANHVPNLHRRNRNIVDMKTTTLHNILKKYNAPKFIEFLSLDTEGSEYEILKNFPFKQFTFGLILVERGQHTQELYELLKTNKYKIILRKKKDDLYSSFISQ